MKAVFQGITELEAIIKFLEGKCQVLQLIHSSQHPKNNNNSGVRKPTKHAYVATHSSCVLCRDKCPLHRCKQFRKANSQQRSYLLSRINCVLIAWVTGIGPPCKVEWRCKFCRRKHNSLLLCESEPAHKNNRNDCNNERQPQSTRTEKITAANQV